MRDARPNLQPDPELLARARALSELVAEHADFADAERHLHPIVATAFAQSGLYRLAAPVALHGADADALTQIAVLEEIAQVDASSGWNLMIGIETFGLIAPSMSGCGDLLADPLRVMASSTAAVGRAEREAGGWRVSGRWQFVSGIHNASLFGATVQLHENGEQVQRQPCYALIEAPDYAIKDTWHTVGMRGSGSHDVTVDGALVPERQIVTSITSIRGESPNLRFPRGARLAYNKAAVALGICRAGLSAFTDLAMGKRPRFSSTSLRRRPFAQRALAQAEVRYFSMRSATHAAVSQMWQQVMDHEPVPPRELAIFQALCCDVAQGTAELSEALAAAAGTSANANAEPLARIVRDAKVIRQHASVAPHHVEDAGRLLLGLEPQEVMLRGIQPDSPEQQDTR